MWHIKSTRMTSRTECKLNFYPRVKLVTLGWGQRSNIIKLRLPCQFQRFSYQTLCVFSQMKDTKHIRWDFYSVTWGRPQGWDYWALGVHRRSFFQTWSCGISNRQRWQAEQNASYILILGTNWWPLGEFKRSNITFMSISRIVTPILVCVLTNERVKLYWTEFSFCCQSHTPGWDLGCWGSQTLGWGFARRLIDCAL